MIAVTGASGRLGALTLEGLLQVVPGHQVVAITRSPGKLRGLEDHGVRVRQGDYTAPETLGPALAGVERLLLISGSDVGKRVEQHRAVIDAARAAGVRFMAYTSMLKADSSAMPVAAEHVATEALLAASRVPHVLLRNGWYIENYTEHLDAPLAHGVFLGSARDGRIAGASRADFAAAAVAVMTTEGHAGRVYELAGHRAFTMTELAEAVSAWLGRDIPYHDVPAEAHRSALTQAGLPAWLVDLLVGADAAIARGDLDSTSRDLHGLIGRNPRTLDEILASLPKPRPNPDALRGD